MTRKQKLQQKYKAKFATRTRFPIKTPEQWNNYNRIIPEDVIVFDTTGHFKIGTGKSKWKNLPYAEPLDIVRENRDPVSTDKYHYGTIWINTTNRAVFVKCIEWQQIFVGEVVNIQDFKNKLDTKVDKVLGKRLSTNDYTDEERASVRTIPDLLVIDDPEFSSELENKINVTDIGDVYYTREQLEILLNDKIDIENTYTKTDFDKFLHKKAENTYSKETFDSLIEERLSKKADLVNGIIPTYQLPSFADDVLEYENLSVFPAIGEHNKIYIDITTNKIYRWSGNHYALISDTIKLGETSDTAFPGDRGEQLRYDIESVYLRLQDKEYGNLAFKNTISTNDIQDSAITTNKLTDGIVTVEKIKTITTNNIADKAVDTSKIADGAVTDEKIKNILVSQLVGEMIFSTNY